MKYQVSFNAVAYVALAIVSWAGPVAGQERRVGGLQPAGLRGEPMSRSERAYPTGDRATSFLLLERFAPAEVRAGEDVRYEIRLTNLTRGRIEGITLSEDFPPGLRVRSVSPPPTRPEATRAIWQVNPLEPASSAVFQVNGICERVDRLVGCANLTLAAQICGTTRVVEPALALRKIAPRDVLLCDEIPMTVVVSNPGTGVARNVRITDTLPPGMRTLDGKNGLVFEAGDLAAGQSREFSFRVRASETGEFRNTARAAEAGGLSAEAASLTVVHQPQLTLTKRGPDVRYLGREATFEITVTNVGDAPATDTVVTDSLPSGGQFAGADQGGQLSGNQVVWRLGQLLPGQSRSVRTTMRLSARGRVQNTATARAYCAEATAGSVMEVRGVAAILLEVVDQEDPIEVGANEIYTIEVTNQGTAEDTNIVVECTLPPQMDFVSADGPTRAAVQDRTIRFAPLPSLAPKALVAYKVIVRGTMAADARFGVSVRSGETEAPVEETESTHIY